MQRISSLACAAALMLSSSAMAKELNVVTTLKPLNLIVSELTQGAATSEAILPPGVSPHDYALRPSDVKKLNEADLVIWVGPELETFLTKVMSTKENSFALTAQAGIHFLNYDGKPDAGHDEHHGHDDHEQHNEHDDHGGHEGHEGHDHSGLNPHFWMGPNQTVEAANVITKALIKHDPLHKAVYLDNLSTFTSEVTQAVNTINAELTPLSDNGYYVFHDGYGYFEHQFHLNKLGHFTVEPDRRPGAKTLMKIRNALQDQQAYCVFSEPQFSPAVVESVVKGTEVKIGTLDPMATNVKAGKGGYVRFIKELGQSFAKCLQR